MEFASALQKLASRAYPGQENTDLFQRLLVNQFIDNLPSPELRLHVRSASPKNLAQAVQRALEMPAIFDEEQRRSNGAAIASASLTPAAIFAVRGSTTALPPAATSTMMSASASDGNHGNVVVGQITVYVGQNLTKAGFDFSLSELFISRS